MKICSECKNEAQYSELFGIWFCNCNLDILNQPERSKREDSEKFDKIFQEMKKKYHNMLVNLSNL